MANTNDAARIMVKSDTATNIRTLICTRPDNSEDFEVRVPLAYTNDEAVSAIHDRYDELASVAISSLAGKSYARPDPVADQSAQAEG